jgi:hypothetical protein
MNQQLEAILDDILRVQNDLRDAPADAFDRRVQLRERLHDLHAAAAAADHDGATAAQLERYVEQLERRRERIMNRRMDPSWEDGALGGMGLPANQTDDLNRRIEEAADLPALEEEIVRIRAKLSVQGD